MTASSDGRSMGEESKRAASQTQIQEAVEANYLAMRLKDLQKAHTSMLQHPAAKLLHS